MINDLKFALYSIKKNIQNESELRFSFILRIVGMAINNIYIRKKRYIR
jgi:diacylglycerol kinase